MNDKVFDKFVVKVNSNQIEQYDDTSHDSKDSLRGIRFKKFIRLDGELFQDLIDEIRTNPKCSYDTYVNDLIKSGYTPKHISVLQKEDNALMSSSDRYGLGHFKDVCASRILNFFECPTTYEMVCDVDGVLSSCSVDFGKYGEEFYTLSSIFPISKNVERELSVKVPEVVQKLSFFAEKKNILDSDDVYKQFVSEYCYSLMIRRYVICDNDFAFHNVGLIHDIENNNFRIAPNFDLEYSFAFPEDRAIIFNRNKELKNDLYYLKINYPQVLHKFITNLNRLCNDEQYINIIEDSIGKNNCSTNFIHRFEEHLREISKVCYLHMGKDIRK